MRFTFTKEQEQFRQEVHDFLKSELNAGTFSTRIGDLTCESNRAFSRKMAQRGWIGLTWPKEFGGQGRSYVDKMIMNEELFKVQAPIGYHFMGDRQVGPAILKFGSDWQKKFFLPRIIRAEENSSFCMLFSEPNAGSDMAAVSTKAENRGDHYLLNGQKVWTSGGHTAAYGWVLARTNRDTSVPGHLACSEFILDMKLPGVTVRPLINIAGAHSFNEVFLEDVRVDKKFLVGQENAGFKQIMAQMDYERAGIERLIQNYMIYSQLQNHVRNMNRDQEDPEFYSWVKQAMGQLETEFSAGRLLCYYTAWLLEQGKNVSTEAALTKAFCTQYEKRVNDVATRILGPISQLKAGSRWLPSPFITDVAESYLWSPSYTLQGGSVEVLKNIIAQRGLGLPRK
ncbi:MAG: Acryloyl-CoA reductase (NADH) [Syntrophaceae bacterium PtaU1.Bin231]|nr:MAG: Acryloyl-CoA reductase (NADH) [Syntrophaceae bacterium PtaU1.Bin231]